MKDTESGPRSGAAWLLHQTFLKVIRVQPLVASTHMSKPTARETLADRN